MFDTNVDSLLNVSVTNNLVKKDTNSRTGHIKHDTGTSVVEVVWETLLDSTVGLDIDNVTLLVGVEVGGETWSSMLLEVPGEFVTSTSAVTVTGFSVLVILGTSSRVHDVYGEYISQSACGGYDYETYV